MMAKVDGDAAGLGAAVTRLERRVAELGAALERQDGKLDELLARTEPEEPEEPEGPPMHKLIAQLVGVMLDTQLTLQSIDRELKRQWADEGRR